MICSPLGKRLVRHFNDFGPVFRMKFDLWFLWTGFMHNGCWSEWSGDTPRAMTGITESSSEIEDLKVFHVPPGDDDGPRVSCRRRLDRLLAPLVR